MTPALQIPLALVGLGAVVRNIHMPAYLGLKKKVRVVAGCDPNPEARDFAKRKWGLRVFETPLEMLRETQPEVAAICTPPWLHREHVSLALQHGCHVFCEKPLADSLADADAMAEAAAAAGKFVAVNNQFPYMRIHLAAKQQIGSPEFGELLYLHAWHTMRTDHVTEAGWRGGLRRRLGFEFGVHVFELVRFFFGEEPTRLLAHMPNPHGQAHCDVVNVIALEFPGGRAASIVLDRLSRGPDQYLEMRLDGERGSIHTSLGGKLRLAAGLHTRERRPFLSWDFVQGGQAVFQDGKRSRTIGKDGINPFASSTALHFENFLRALGEGVAPPGDIRDNRKTLALVMAAYESADSGKWIHLDG